MRILTGSSFSGNERNCCFLNTGADAKQEERRRNRFADVSAASGLNHLDDSRSIAVTDWDNDGDLDLWITNRTSPRIRFLRNDTPTSNSFVAFELEGLPAQNCPRDAYGGRVTVTFKDSSGETSQRTQTLHGGDSFLSQSTRWLHFGMQPDESIQTVSVRWPGSKTPQSYSGMEAGQRWRLVQSQSVAQKVRSRNSSAAPLQAKTLAGVPLKSTGRVKISWPQSVGDLKYQSFDGRTVTQKAVSARPTLYMCWASWCSPCLAELKEISQTEMGDVEVIALNIEEATTGEGPTGAEQQKILDQLDFNGTRGIATLSLLATLNQKHLEAIYVRTDLPLPVTFLVDKKGLLRVVYKGKIDIQQVKQDLQTLDAIGRDSMALAIPFPGRWSEEYLDGNPIAVARAYQQDGTPEDAETFLKHYLNISQPKNADEEPLDTRTKLLRAASWYELAMLAFRDGRSEEAFANCERSLDLAPKSVPTLLAMIGHLATTGDYQKAAPYCETIKRIAPENASVNFQLGRIELGKKDFVAAADRFGKAFAANPRMLPAGNNLAWILATNSDPKLRDGKRAVEIAENICETTQYQDYRFFGTLAAAYAEIGDFENAVSIIEKGLQMANAKGDDSAIASFQQRLITLKAKQSVRE